jgi:rifampicin phosphotransferase
VSARLPDAILSLDRLTAADASRAGGKAWNCARLRQAGFRVPDGLVVLSTATEADLEGLASHPWLDTVPVDTVFAVRSSGLGEDGVEQSFAGIHQTSLDVRRADLVTAVAACRASAHTAQALEYRRARGLSTSEIGMGVLIQRMVHPVAAGVAFTVNPVTGAGDELVINSSWGVGEALVSGQVDPDEFVVGKLDRTLRWSRVGEKASGAGRSGTSLSPDRVRELAGILLDIERHYGAPQDVEWCHDGAEFWIVQSRPVTTARAATGETEWTRANVAEVLPDLTSPQVAAVLEDMLNRAERRHLGKALAPEERVGPLVKSFHGRLYFNLAQMRHVCALGGVAPAQMLRSMGHADAIRPEDEKPQRASLGDVAAAMPSLLRMAWGHVRVARVVREDLARVAAHHRRLAADPRPLSDAEVWSALEAWVADAPECMRAVLLLAGVLFHEMPVRKACAKAGFPFERLVYPQLATGERSVSAQQAFDLLALAEAARREPEAARYLCGEAPDIAQMRVALRGTAFLGELERFLEAYGHRGHYESDWSRPRYHEDPTPILQALRAHLASGAGADPSGIMARQEREAAEAWAAFAQRLSPWQRWTTLPRLRRAIRTIKQYYLWREKVRSELVQALSAVRRWHLALADRFVERGWLDFRDDYFLLLLPEITAVMEGKRRPETLRGLAAERAAETARHRALSMPLLMRESQLAQLIRISGVSERSADESQLTGYPVSGGCVEAEVVVVRDPADFGRMKRGAILVAPATDPSWTPLFTLAAGVIVEVGGVLSHASTIAREYGLPALANVKHATKRLRTGERVRLDAVHGVVTRLDHAKDAVGTPGLVEVG